MCPAELAAKQQRDYFDWGSSAVAVQDTGAGTLLAKTAAAVSPALGAVADWAAVAAWGLLEVPIWVDVPTVHACTLAQSSSAVFQFGEPLSDCLMLPVEQRMACERWRWG